MRELNIAVIGGAGFMGRAHSLAYRLADASADLGAKVRLHTLVDANAQAGAEAARTLGWAHASTNWESVVADESIDIVDICTPPPWHLPIARAAMAAGKHVFCEKPLSNSGAESAEMASLAASSPVVTQVGYNYRHASAIEHAHRLLARGELGDPLMFRGTYLQETAFGADPDRWRASRSTGGSGAIGDIGSHLIDTAEYLLGPVRRVSAVARSMGETGWLPDGDRRRADVLDDGGAWIAEFASGAIGSFSASFVAAGRKNEFAYSLDTTTAAVSFNWNQREVFDVAYVGEPAAEAGRKLIHTSSAHPDGWWRLAGLGNGYIDISAIQFQKFVRRILGENVEAPDFAHAAHVQRVVDAIYHSSETGAWVDVAPAEGGTP